MLRDPLLAWIDRHSRPALGALIAAAFGLRVLLAVHSPTPYGYVFDYYHEGVQLLYEHGGLPQSTDCWQCYHPPLFYLAGLPFYATGQWLADTGRAGPDARLRVLSLLPLLSGAVILYYGWRLLRLFRQRGAHLILGVALLAGLPALFITSYAVEADILIAAILAAFIYYLVRDFTRPHLATSGAALRLGLLAGLAMATKYSGLLALVGAGAVLGLQTLTGPARPRAVRNGVIVLLAALAIGSWKYVDNQRHYGTPFFANGPAAEGFQLRQKQFRWERYDFLTLRLPQLIQVTAGCGPLRPLTELPVYYSVWTTLHGMTWTDMSVFSVPRRHGYGAESPYSWRTISYPVIVLVLTLGLLPQALAIAGFAITIRRPSFYPLTIMVVASLLVYFSWVVPQPWWALKTKYLLFLVPAYVLYVLIGLRWVRRALPSIGARLVVALLVAAIVIAHIYVYQFARG
jgi:4-amino-4-deoxy-L-arabinose transferase-like glycosyltransferase